MNKTIYNEEKFVEKYPDLTAAEAIDNINRETKQNQNRIKGMRNRRIGKNFEEVIEAACNYYKSIELAIIEKTPEPMKVLGKANKGKFQACFIKKAQPDFKGCTANGKAIAFEAKATEKDRIRKCAVTDEQSKFLESYWKMNAQAFVLVSFNLERCYRVPWGIWREMETLYGRKYLLETDIVDCRLKFKHGCLDFLKAEVK